MSAAARRFRWVLGATSPLALGVALATPSCGPGFLDGLSGGPPIVDAGEHADVDGAACVLAALPERPDAGAEGPDISVTFALEALRIDTKRDVDTSAIPPPRGVDLDGTCSCPASGSCTPADAGVRGCDGEGGRDNALGAVFGQVDVAVSQIGPAFTTDRIRDGRYTMLVEIRGWNGSRDDPVVTASLRMSKGLDRAAFDGGRSTPMFDGSDVWTVDPTSIVGGEGQVGADCRAGDLAAPCFAKLTDTNAYVRGGQLVVRLSGEPTSASAAELVLRTTLGRFVFELTDARLTAKIVEVDGGSRGYRLEAGEITGRWPVESVLRGFANLELEDGVYLCDLGTTSDSYYGLLKQTVCGALDLAPFPTVDGRGEPCGALSSAMSFTASPAAAGHVDRGDREIDGGCRGWLDDCSR